MVKHPLITTVVILCFSFMSAVHVIQKKVNWTNKQPIIITQRPGKSRKTTSSNVTSVGAPHGKKKKEEKGG